MLSENNVPKVKICIEQFIFPDIIYETKGKEIFFFYLKSLVKNYQE